MTTLIPKYDLATTGSVNRAFNLKLAETVSVKDFGAKGDGTTDDTTAIQNAVTYLSSGGTLLFPAGTYIVKYAIPLANGIHYLGDSIATTTIKASATSWDNILGDGYPTAANISNVIIENITFDGNKAARTENQLALIGTASTAFTNGETVTSSSGGTAIVAAHTVGNTQITLVPSSIVGTFTVGNTVTGASSGATMTIGSKGADDAYQINIRAQQLINSTIKNCQIINSFFTALSLYNNCQQVTVENCLLTDNNKSGTTLSSPYNIYIESFAKNVTIDNCYVAGGLGSGIVLRGGVCRAVKIINNSIVNTLNYGIEIQSGADAMSDIFVSGNSLYAAPNLSADCITVIGNSEINGVVISDNIIDTAVNAIGLRLAVNGATVTGNIFKDVTTASVGIYGTGVTNYTLVNNVSNTNGSMGVYFNDLSWSSGTGSPEGVIFANVGSIYSREDGAAGTTFYVKQVGNATTATGWGATVATFNGLTWTSGTGSPEGVVTAPIGALFSRTDGSTSTTLYVKTSGTGNTGWTAK